MDLTKFESETVEDGEWCTILDPTTGDPLANGDGSLTRVLLAGQDSVRWKEAKRRLMKQARQGKLKDDLEESGIELLASVTIQWEGVTVEGKELDCSADNIRRVYRRFNFFREQVDLFVSNRANYLGNSSRASASTSAPLPTAAK